MLMGSHQPAAAGSLPKRVVALDWSLAETMLALGAVPLAVGEAPNYRTWLTEPRLPPQVVDLGLMTEPNLELLVQLAPDLILVGNGQEAAIGRLLERIAPTVALSIYNGSEPPLQRARAVALELASLLGREEAGTALLASADRAFALARARLTACRSGRARCWCSSSRTSATAGSPIAMGSSRVCWTSSASSMAGRPSPASGDSP